MMKKKIKLYNIVFPIWFLLFYPPIVLATLLGNFIIDSLVLVACFYAFKLVNLLSLKEFYSRNVIKVWALGFLADAVGAGLLFLISEFLLTRFGVSDEFVSGIIHAVSFDPFYHAGGLIVILLSILIAGLLIFVFNYGIVFKNQVADRYLRFKLALTIAVVTMPWTFLIPNRWINS